MLPMLSPIMDFAAIGGTPGVDTPESPDSLAYGSDTVVSACAALITLIGWVLRAVGARLTGPSWPLAAAPWQAGSPRLCTQALLARPVGPCCLVRCRRPSVQAGSELAGTALPSAPATPAGPHAAAGQRRQAQARRAAVSSAPARRRRCPGPGPGRSHHGCPAFRAQGSRTASARCRCCCVRAAPHARAPGADCPTHEHSCRQNEPSSAACLAARPPASQAAWSAAFPFAVPLSSTPEGSVLVSGSVLRLPCGSPPLHHFLCTCPDSATPHPLAQRPALPAAWPLCRGPPCPPPKLTPPQALASLRRPLAPLPAPLVFLHSLVLPYGTCGRRRRNGRRALPPRRVAPSPRRRPQLSFTRSSPPHRNGLLFKWRRRARPPAFHVALALRPRALPCAGSPPPLAHPDFFQSGSPLRGRTCAAGAPASSASAEQRNESSPCVFSNPLPLPPPLVPPAPTKGPY
ncbi:hypothetical protein ABPG75_004988 [Micractinium tetrahymenae]